MVGALTRLLGVHNLALAEDVVQEAFCRAADVWKFRGVPENPAAWLMATAKNCALDALRRERTARTFGPALERHLQSEWTLAPVVEEFFAADAIKDDLLRMMFTCCHPRLPEAAQVALILHVLCGFSVGEVAAALMSSHDAVEKRLTRAKETLARAKTAVRRRRRPRVRRPRALRCAARSISSSTKAITALRRKPRFARSFAPRRCGLTACCSTIRGDGARRLLRLRR